MAKKKTAKKKSGPAKKAAPAKSTRKKMLYECPKCGSEIDSTAVAKGNRKKTTPPELEKDMIEIVPDALEQQALDLVQTSETLCDDLEEGVTAAVSKAVGTVFKKHGVVLSAEQAENVALILFGN
jgi:hypothetical protein